MVFGTVYAELVVVILGRNIQLLTNPNFNIAHIGFIIYDVHMINIWNTIFMEPLYNGLIFLVNNLPGASLALSVIVLTIIVRIILYPLSVKSIRTQIIQKKLQPDVKRIRDEIKDPKEQSTAIMKLYKDNNTNPFSGCLIILLQLPIILALYRVFLTDLHEQSHFLYNGVILNPDINTMFFGFIDLTEKSIILAGLAALAQYLQMRFSPIHSNDKNEIKLVLTENDDPKEQIMKNMQSSMKIAMPIMIFVFSMLIPSAVALYWTVSAIFMTVQEYIVKNKFKLNGGNISVDES